MKPRRQASETRAALAAAWTTLPPALHLPTQFLGRHYAGCAATIGVMPRCDFRCGGCYLGSDANSMRPRPVDELKAQMRAVRAWLGPAGNLQLTDGEVTLRPVSELIELIAYARSIGLVPMLMTHGETFRRKQGLLERLMVGGGLTEVSFHVDTTMRGRRDGYAAATSEAELDGLRAEFADMIRSARRHTGRRLEAASTVTVTRFNLDGVPEIVRWFLRNADAFKMVSFQPLATVGRTDPALESVTPDELWTRIAEGVGDPLLARGQGYLGHPSCSRFVQGIAARRRERVWFVPLYRHDQSSEMRFLGDLLDRVGGTSFRLDGRSRRLVRAAGLMVRHVSFLLTRVLPYLWQLARRMGTLRGRYFCIVSHHFMSATEATSPLGRDRLSACALRVPIDGRLEPMCAVNALGSRESFYRSGLDGGESASRLMREPESSATGNDTMALRLQRGTRWVSVALAALGLACTGAPVGALEREPRQEAVEGPAPGAEPDSVPMDPERLDRLLRRVDAETQRQGNTWQLAVDGTTVHVISDPAHDRMRILVAVGDSETLPPARLKRLLQANFDTALDARYAIGRGVLWATYIHPLGPLTEPQLLSGLAQTVALARTYGSTYTSGVLTFGGGDSRELREEPVPAD